MTKALPVQLESEAAPSGPAYNSSDLSFLQDLVDGALADLVESGDYPLAEKNREVLRHRLAIAAFQAAAAGERDADALRRRMLDIFFAPASARPRAWER